MKIHHALSFAASLLVAVWFTSQAVASVLPPVPGWQTDPAACSWQWRQGDGMGLWTESCTLSTGQWEVGWNVEASAFVLQLNGQVQQVVVQSWPLSKEGGLERLRQSLVQAGQLPESAPCQFVGVALNNKTSGCFNDPLGTFVHIDARGDEMSVS